MYRRGFDLDPSCKLYLPFYRYGGGQTRIVDMSGNNNHGVITGAIPYPGNPQMTGIGSTFNRGDFTATNAFFWSSIDLSPLAGTDLGSTPFYIEALDGAGKKATGYLGRAGGDLELIPEATNPVLSLTGEPSIIMDGNQADVWCAGGINYTTLYYTYATDSSCKNYATPQAVLSNIRFPYVLKEGSIYYLFAKKTDSGTPGIYLWQSSNKTTWTIMNSGNQVFVPDTYIWNVGVVVVGSTWHMFIESGNEPDQSDVGLRYSYSTIGDMNWNTHYVSGKIIDKGGSPHPIYVPDRNSIMIIAPTLDPFWDIKVFHANLSDNLALSTSWHESPYFKISYPNMHTTDPSFVVAGAAKDYNIIIQYLYNQATVYQTYSDLSLDDFFDAIQNGSGASVEVLGSELFLNPGFDADTDWWHQVGWVIDGIATCDGTPDAYMNQQVSPSQGKLVRFSVDVKTITSGNILLIGNTWSWTSGAYNTTGIKTAYFTSPNDNAGAGIYSSSFIGSIDDASLKRVTDPPSTAVHIVSSLNGTTRNWASIESGFDPNTIASWKINSVVPSTCIGWYFDGVDDKVDCGTDPSLDFVNQISILMWINLHELNKAHFLVTKSATQIFWVWEGNNNLYFDLPSATLRLNGQPSGGFKMNQWYCVAGTYNKDGGTGNFNLFADGVNIASATDTDAISIGTDNLIIGNHSSSPKGAIGEVLIFNRALSSLEVRNYYELTRAKYGV